MADVSQALILTDGAGRPISAATLRHFIGESYDVSALRDVAAGLLDGSLKLARRNIELRALMMRWVAEVNAEAQPAPAAPAPTPVSINFEPGAFNVQPAVVNVDMPKPEPPSDVEVLNAEGKVVSRTRRVTVAP